ncbi:MAG: GGDEF domain-containing protein, partial [Xanthomonadales bacterium]|nr:GGDEF domain-containing protein [Xanthomonadales bacterium]
MPTIADVRAKYPQYKDLSDDQLAQGMHRKFYSDMPFEEFAKRIQYSPAIPAPDVNALDVGGSIVAQAAQGTGDVLGSMERTSATPMARVANLAAPLAFGPPDPFGANAKVYGMVGDFLRERSGDVREFAGQAASAITSAVGFGDETAEDVYRRTSADTPEMERSRKENVITGDITSPSTVSLGTNPTMIGMATNIGDTAARMAPVIVGARINPLLGVTAGGMQNYEGARTEESDRIGNLPREQIVAMPRFRELVAEETGKPFEEGYADISAASSRLFDGPGTDEDKAIAEAGARALQRLKDEAGNASGWASVPLGMLQGLIFTGKIGKAISTGVRGSSTGVVGAARAAAGTATGMTAAALGEAATEVGQKVSSAYGSTLATGEQGRNLTEDTAADAILGGAMGAGTNVSLPKPKVIDKVFGGEGIKAGDVLGEVGDEDAPAPGPPPTPGPMPPRARAGYTFDENGNIIEQGGGLVPVGPSPVAPESPGYGMGPLGPLQSDAANPDFMVDPQGSASAPGDWRAREQARRAQSGGPGMGPAVNGDPTMPEADMAQAAFDSSIEAMQLAIGRKPTKASMSATAATIATRFGVDPAALIARHAQKPAASVEPVTTPPNPASVAVPVPVVPPTVRTVGVHPNAPQEAPAPVPTGKMWRRGKSALAVQTADGTWFVRVKRGTQWQAWQKRETFDPSGAFGYSPYTPPSGNVRINGKVHAVGERRSEAKQAKAPPDVIDSIIAAGGLNREEMRKHGIDPRMFGTRRGATKWVFPRNGGMTLDALRQRLIDDGYFPPEDPDAPPTISNDDAFEIVQRALNQGERIVSTTHAGAEAAYQEARNAIEAGSIDAMDAEAASDYLSRIEGDEIARGVFDQLDPDEDVEGMSLNELVERALAAGVTPQEMRKAYDLYGFDGEPTAEPVAARNLWELIRTKEKDNGAITRTRSADRGNGPAPAPQEPATVGNAAQRPETNGNEGGTVGRDQPEGGDAAREQAGVERRTGSDRSAVDALPANERDAEIQRLRAENAELQRQLDTDPLTGVLSRAAYERDIQNARGVATIDLKQFKGYNTVGGQTGGDLVLKAFAKAMKDAESDGVRAYRPGGDEFAFLSADNEQSARDAADRLQQFAADIRLSLGKDGVTYSIEGVPFTAGIGHDAESADTNLSANKGDYDRNALPESIRRTDQGDVGSGNEADGDGRNAAERDVQGPADPLTLTDNTVVTPPRAQRPASQSGLFGPVTDIDRQRLRFERDKPKPEKTDTVDIEDAINQTPPTGGVSVSTPTEGDRNAQKPDVDTSA